MENSLDYQYIWLLEKIKEDGVVKETRNGEVRSIFGFHLRHRMDEGFPLLTTKKMWWKGIRTELEWFLNGSSDIRDLWKKGNTIWDGDWYKNYKNSVSEPYTLEEVKEKVKSGNNHFSDSMFDLGPIYGKQWRNWGAKRGQTSDSYTVGIDQIQNLIDGLIEKPDSRRLMVNAWNVGELDDMVLPPCHYGFQIWTRKLTDEEKEEYNKNTIYKADRGISLMWNQRSVDVPLGLPFNIASYGLLLKMIADEVMMKPLELIGSLGDCHIYENQMEGVEEQLQRYSHPLPEVQIMDGIYSRGDQDIQLVDYKSEPKIDFPLSN